MTKSKSRLKSPDRRISETFLQFAVPLFDGIPLNATEVQMEEPLRFAWTVWNAVVYADAGENGQILEGIRTLVGHDPQAKDLVEGLIQRKRKDFGDVDLLIGEYKLFRKDGELRLRAEARDPRPSSR